MLSRNLCNYEIALHILRIQILHAHLNMSTIHKHKRRVGGESFWATSSIDRREVRALWVDEALNGGTHLGFAPLPRLRRKEFLWVGKIPRSPWRGGLEYIPDVDCDNGGTRACYVCSLPVYMKEIQTMTWVQLCMQQKLHILEIAHWCCTIQDWCTVSWYWECTALSPDCANSWIAWNSHTQSPWWLYRKIWHITWFEQMLLKCTCIMLHSAPCCLICQFSIHPICVCSGSHPNGPNRPHNPSWGVEFFL